MELEVLWANFKNQIKEELSSLAYETWFKDTKLYKLDNGKAYIIVPMPIHKKHLSYNYYDQIKNKLNDITNTNFEIEFILEDEIEDNPIKKIEDIPEAMPNNKIENNLNSNYTFNNFIVGESNQLARATALSVAENPGKLYNPLFIYGNSGLGKTHLMHAIGNYIVENSNKRVLYVTSDQFIEDFVGINRKDADGNNFDNISIFKEKYRNLDVLMIDDIQFLGGAEGSQKEFFHTFNTLYGDSKQIIISSDRSPNDLKKLEDRLKTRFYWGLTVDIKPPDFALRYAILKKNIDVNNLTNYIKNDVIEYIASNIGSNVREIEGAVTRLLAYSTMMGGIDITLSIASEALKDIISKGITEKNEIHRIQKIVAEQFQINVDDMKSKKKSNNIAFPRQIAMYLCRNMTSESFPKIGTEFGGRDHSTVMHSVEKIEKEIKINKDLEKIIEKLKKDIA